MHSDSTGGYQDAPERPSAGADVRWLPRPYDSFTALEGEARHPAGWIGLANEPRRERERLATRVVEPERHVSVSRSPQDGDRELAPQNVLLLVADHELHSTLTSVTIRSTAYLDNDHRCIRGTARITRPDDGIPQRELWPRE